MNYTKSIFTLSIFAFVLLALTFASALGVTTNDLSNSTSLSQTFTYTLSDVNSDASSCALYLNNTFSKSNASVLVNGTNTISQNLSIGNYSWFISCLNSTASVNSTVKNFSILTNPAVSVSESGLSKTSNGTVTVTNTGNIVLNNVVLSLSTDAAFTATLGQTSLGSLSPGQSISTSITSADAAGISLGDDNSLTLSLTSDKANATTQVVVSTNFCTNGTVGNLLVDNIDITDTGSGDDTDWNPLDSISIDADIHNRASVSISSIYAQIKILDSDNNDVTDDFNFQEKKIDVGKLGDGDDETVTFTIDSIPADVNDGDYTIYIKAYKSGNESGQCYSASEKISVSRQNTEAVVVKNSDLDQKTLSCGQNNELSFNVYNIGNDKEDSVLVNLHNSELKIDAYQTISKLKSGDNALITFNFAVPQFLNKTKYNFQIITYFDYRSGDDVTDPASYRQNSVDDLDENFILPVLFDNCQITPQVAISASLTSAAKVGDNLVVQATITNTGAAADFIISPSAYDSWASLVSVDPQTVNIPQGQSKQVTITLKPTATGAQQFSIDAKSTTGQTVSQKLQVSVASSTGIFSSLSSLGQTGTFLVVAIVILVILILVVLIVRGRRPEQL